MFIFIVLLCSFITIFVTLSSSTINTFDLFCSLKMHSKYYLLLKHNKLFYFFQHCHFYGERSLIYNLIYFLYHFFFSYILILMSDVLLIVRFTTFSLSLNRRQWFLIYYHIYYYVLMDFFLFFLGCSLSYSKESHPLARYLLYEC